MMGEDGVDIKISEMSQRNLSMMPSWCQHGATGNAPLIGDNGNTDDSI